MRGVAEYDRYDATGLAELVRRREVSPAELLEQAIARTEALNPQLNAVIRRMYELGRRSAAGSLDGTPFPGVPFLLKDLIQAYAGVPLTSGSAALRDHVPDRDSEVVARFRNAGLVIFGKTNVPEFGLVATTEPQAFGPTRNPWNLARSPGGSSGGSAAAVAAGIVPMASGNDGGGSLRIPAAWCGLFGFKPSRGRVPAGPHSGEYWGGAVSDHVLTRSVRDSATMLDAIAGPSLGDPYPLAIPARPFASELATALGPLRIAYCTRSPIGSPVDPECRRAVERAATLLSDLGHEVVEAEPPIDGMEVVRAYLMHYFGQVAADLRWVDRVQGARAARRVEETTRVAAVIGEHVPAGEFVDSRRKWNEFGRTMGAFHLDYDLYMTPTTASLPLEIGSLSLSTLERNALRVVNRLGAGRTIRASGLPERIALENLGPVPFTQLANLTGQPAMSVPLHWSDDDLPCGVHFMAAVGNEAVLFRLAARLEEARPWFDRRPQPLVAHSAAPNRSPAPPNATSTDPTGR